MAKDRLFDVPETKSEFCLLGKVSGVKKDYFFKEGTSSKGNAYRNLKFNLEIEKGKSIPISLNGYETPYVYFYKKSEVQGQKGDTQSVKWDERAKWNREGYNLMGVTCGLEKDEETNKNSLNTLVAYDACEYIRQRLTILGDETMVRIIGKMEHSHYTNKKGDVVSKTEFVIDKIYLSDTDLEKVDEEQKSRNHFFHQMMVITSVEPDKYCKDETRFLIQGYAVGYSNVESVCFYTRLPKMAKLFATLSKKDYIGVQIFGEIEVKKEVIEVKEEDEWGMPDISKVAYGNGKIEMYATGADKETLDKSAFTRAKIEEAIVKIQNNDKAKAEFDGNANVELEMADADIDDAFADWD